MENSFNSGYRQIAFTDTAKRVKREIMVGLAIQTDPGFTLRKSGAVSHSPAERRFIESVFAQNGVKKDVWGK